MYELHFKNSLTIHGHFVVQLYINGNALIPNQRLASWLGAPSDKLMNKENNLDN